MFGKRADGRVVKNMHIIDRAMPYFMPQRIDAVNLFAQDWNIASAEQFILDAKKETGVHYSLTEIVLAAAVRMLYERPKTNRFINNCKVYQRNRITISMSVKKTLKDDGEEMTLKMYFTGRESLPEVKKIFENEIAVNVKAADESHQTTKTAGALGKVPGWMFKFAMWLFRFMDRHDMLPAKLIHISPFHTSMWVTDLRSIKLDKIYHHLYNFGNSSIFTSIGKANYVPVANRDGEVKVEKHIKLGFSLDDRICDGLYYGNSVRHHFLKYINNPELLMQPLPEPELSGKELKRKQKADKKLAKRLAKKEKQDAKRLAEAEEK